MTIGTRLFTLLHGKRVGKDPFGNVYYVEKSTRKGKRQRRWVVYQGMAEPSKVPPMWHAWLHHVSDTIPTDQDIMPYAWQKPHLPNLTGTKAAHFPSGDERAGGKRAASSSDYQAWTPSKQ